MYKQMIAEYMRREAVLKQQVLELTIEVAELKDSLINYGYTPTDGYEVGSASDYEDNPQMELFKDK